MSNLEASIKGLFTMDNLGRFAVNTGVLKISSGYFGSPMSLKRSAIVSGVIMATDAIVAPYATNFIKSHSGGDVKRN